MSARESDGEDAVPFSWSMVVSLQHDCRGDGNRRTHYCTGTILSESFVLTSARCVEAMDASQLRSGQVTVMATGTKSRTVNRIIIHPGWKEGSNGLTNDIALLQLAEPFDFAKDVSLTRTCRPSNLNSAIDLKQHFSNDTILVTVGWGPRGLQQAAVPAVHQDQPMCGRMIENPELQFCVGLRKDNQGSVSHSFVRIFVRS